ncbi:MAG: hypothetical protein AAFN78_09675 [Pseudomonadota bacterium]
MVARAGSVNRVVTPVRYGTLRLSGKPLADEFESDPLMALINCPACDLPISSLVEACPRCGGPPDGGRRGKRGFDRNPHYLVSVSVFLVGCYLFWRDWQLGAQASPVSASLMAVGLLWYVVVRFWPR